MMRDIPMRGGITFLIKIGLEKEVIPRISFHCGYNVLRTEIKRRKKWHYQ